MNLVWNLSKSVCWKKKNPESGCGVINWTHRFITSQESSVVARKEGNQSVISDAMEGETPLSLINVHPSNFLKNPFRVFEPTLGGSLICDRYCARCVIMSLDPAAQQNRQRHFTLKVTSLPLTDWNARTPPLLPWSFRLAPSSRLLPRFPSVPGKFHFCSRLEKQREDGESLMTLYLLTFPLLHSGGRKPHWFRHISSLTKRKKDIFPFVLVKLVPGEANRCCHSCIL